MPNYNPYSTLLNPNKQTQEDISSAIPSNDPITLNAVLNQLADLSKKQTADAEKQNLQNLQLQQAALENYSQPVDLSPLGALVSGFQGLEGQGALIAGQKAPKSFNQTLAETQALYPQIDLNKNQIDILKTQLSLLNKSKDSSDDILKDLRVQKLKQEIGDKEFKKTPAGKLEGLSAEQKKRFEGVNFALRALTDLEDIESQGQNRKGNVDLNKISIIGDNPFTFARNRFTEAIGRLQSGGAINKEEAANFRKLIPTPIDSPEIAREKLIKMRDELEARFNNFGVKKSNASEAGLDPAKLGFDKNHLTEKKEEVKDKGLEEFLKKRGK